MFGVPLLPADKEAGPPLPLPPRLPVKLNPTVPPDDGLYCPPVSSVASQEIDPPEFKVNVS